MVIERIKERILGFKCTILYDGNILYRDAKEILMKEDGHHGPRGMLFFCFILLMVMIFLNGLLNCVFVLYLEICVKCLFSAYI